MSDVLIGINAEVHTDVFITDVSIATKYNYAYHLLS